jgi:hypothetical protein
MQMLAEPYSVMGCGHTFCRTCIVRHISQSPACPLCGTETSSNHLIPNHTAAALIDSVRRTRQSITTFKRLASEMSQNFNQDFESLISPIDSVETIENTIAQLKHTCMEMSLNEEKKQNILLNEFFDRMIAKRNDTISQLVKEIHMLNVDKNRVNVSQLNSRVDEHSLF